MKKKMGFALLAAMGAALPAAGQTVLYDNTTILTNAAGEPLVPNVDSPPTSDPTGNCCVELSYLEDVTVAAGGVIGDITFSIYNAGQLAGEPFQTCFGNTDTFGDVFVYRDPDGLGPDADFDGFPDPDRLIASSPFMATAMCGTTPAETVIVTVNVADQNAMVSAGDRIFVEVDTGRDLFRQVQAGPVAVGSTSDGYWLADPTVAPADSGFIRTGDPDANLYLKITAGGIMPPGCPCELDGAPGVDVFDLLAYLDLWFAGDLAADIDGTPGVDVFDLLAYLDCWFPASAGEPCL